MKAEDRLDKYHYPYNWDTLRTEADRAVALLRKIVIHHNHTPFRAESGVIDFVAMMESCDGCRCEFERQEFLEGGDNGIQPK